MFAASTGNVDSARLMLEYGFSRALEEVQSQNRSGLDTIYVASLYCDKTLAHQLMKEGSLDIASAALSDGTTPLMLAAYSNCLPVLTLILDYFATLYSANDIAVRVDYTGTHGLSAFMVGVLRGSVKCVKLLLKNGASINQKHAFAHTTPLHMAAELGHVGVINLLCSNGVNSSAITSIGGTALHTAAQVNMGKSVKPLLKVCKISPDVLMLSDTTPLYIAAQNGFDKFVKTIISFGANIYYSMPIDDYSFQKSSSLVEISQNSGQDNVFLENTVSVNSEAANGATALHAAAENGHHTVVELLLHYAEAKGNSEFVNDQSLGVTPLHLAAEYNRVQVARVLFKYNASVNVQAAIDGTPPLYHAISAGHKEVAMLLLTEGGADPSISPCLSSSSLRRTSPLNLAIIQGKLFVNMLKQMIEHPSANPNHTDCAGRSALHLSSALPDKYALSLLLQHGGNVLSTNSRGESLLHVAIAHNRFDCVGILLRYLGTVDEAIPHALVSSIVEKKTEDGYTALQLAATECNRHEILQLLVDAVVNNVSSLSSINNSTARATHFAAAKGCMVSFKSLVKAGFGIKSEHERESILIAAIKYNRQAVVEYILEKYPVSLHYDAEQSQVTDNPLLYAVVQRRSEIVRILLDSGAECNIFVVLSSAPNADPSSLLDLAQQRRDFDTAKVLSLHPSCSDVS